MPEYVVSKEELKEALKELYDKYHTGYETMNLEDKVKMLTLIVDTQAALLAREAGYDDYRPFN